MTFFSVVIPLYNKAEHIQRSIDSVLAQKIQDFEIIVINDGSTDGGEKIVKRYTDTRIKIIDQKNSGVSEARNRGILIAKGEYVAFLDADDFWFPDYLVTIKSLVKRFPQSGVFATAYKVKEPNGKYYKVNFAPIPPYPWEGVIENYFECLASGNYSVRTSAVCVKKNIFEKVGLFDTSLRMGEDIDMWIRLFLNSKIAFSTKPKAIYFEDTSNKFDANKDEFTLELKKLIEKYQSQKYLENIPQKYHCLFKKSIGIKLYDLIKRYLYLGRKKEAIRVLKYNLEYFNLKNMLIVYVMIIIPTFMVLPIRGILSRKMG